MTISASRKLIPPKRCPSCSLALLRAFASACGSPLPPPLRRTGRTAYQSVTLVESRAGFKSWGAAVGSRIRPNRANVGWVNSTAEFEREAGRLEKQLDEEFEAEEREMEEEQRKSMNDMTDGQRIWEVISSAGEESSDGPKKVYNSKDPELLQQVEDIQRDSVQEMIRMIEAHDDIGKPMAWEKLDNKTVLEDIDRRLAMMKTKRLEKARRQEEEELARQLQKKETKPAEELAESDEPRIELVNGRKEDLVKAMITESIGEFEEALDTAQVQQQALSDEVGRIKAQEVISETEPSNIKTANQQKITTGELNLAQSLQIEEEEMIENLEKMLERLDDYEEVLGEEKVLALREKIESRLEEAEELYEELYAEAPASTESELERKERDEDEDIEYKVMEPSTTPESSDGATPWYLQSPMQPAPRRFVSPLIEQMPELPPNPPDNFEVLLNYLIKDLSLSKIKIMDLRGLEPTPAIGPNVLMILATARSERHMSIAADKCARYMRGMTPGSHIYADGLMGRGEIKLRERRERRKGKRRTAEDEEALRVGWICVNSGRGIVVQVMTGWKREELNLEGLWSRKIHTSMKRKLKDKLMAEGVGAEEIKEIVARDLPDVFDEPPEYDAKEDRIEAKKIERRLMISDGLIPDHPDLELEEFQDTLQASEIHSKSKKKPKEEGRRYIDIPAVKPRRISLKEKRKQLDDVMFSTKRAFSTSARRSSTILEAVREQEMAPFVKPAGETDSVVEALVTRGEYKKILKLYPRPRTDAQTTLVLLAHLNHLVQTPPEIAATTLLASDKDRRYNTPFFTSFTLSCAKTPTPTHHHIEALFNLSAHRISPLIYPLQKFATLPSTMLLKGSQVPLITYHAILRAVATSPILRGDHPVTMSFWSNRTSDTLGTMTLYLLRKMDISGIEIGHDPEIFESLWLAMSPGDTTEYIASLGDASRRSGKIDDDKPFSRAIDHRMQLYKDFHMQWYDPYKFIPKECDHFRGPQVEIDVLDKLLDSSLAYPPVRPENRYASLPSYLVTMFVTLARAKSWRWLKGVWRWLPSKGVRRPKALYALYFELLAREAEVRVVIEVMRYLLTDYEREYVAGKDEVTDGVAEGILGCVKFMEREVPGTGAEFGRWKRRCESYLNGGVSGGESDYTYVI
ncbi:hypothetical protein H072_371 [Dactylellina haptotyla CBS 200.50]|uniref:ATPase synthesis protein 25 n=1 Tax=Dactylellina haptotyla (strain CBS 200.50) TaxID=1284197 RepID=S8AXB7_DACHA|nr:hypothetical protein H072_371 [Dactylellina haptotyla CBS 200.50]